MSNSFSNLTNVKNNYANIAKITATSSILGKSHRNIMENNLSIKTTLRTKAELEEYYETDDENELFILIMEEISELHKYTLYVWQNYLTLLFSIPGKTFASLVRENFKKENIFKERSMIIHRTIKEESRNT